jgi:hypothetical protein
MTSPSALMSSLLVVYAIIGCVAAILAFAYGSGKMGMVSDAILLLLLWPLYGPFFLLQSQHGDAAPLAASAASAASDREAAFLLAIRRAAGTPLGTLLPDGRTARALARRLRVAGRKVHELDELLARPDFSEGETVARLSSLETNHASVAALSSVTMRLGNIRRLHSLRNRFARELDEVGELLAQLTAQAELLRIDQAQDPAGNQLVSELLSRVEGLDQILDDGGLLAPRVSA